MSRKLENPALASPDSPTVFSPLYQPTKPPHLPRRRPADSSSEQPGGGSGLPNRPLYHGPRSGIFRPVQGFTSSNHVIQKDGHFRCLTRQSCKREEEKRGGAERLRGGDHVFPHHWPGVSTRNVIRGATSRYREPGSKKKAAR
ncbi:hypothetical protein LX36DRAFT_198153 [Colletotrichum falcatum]|nr:hypothetical protein LX36DRAFT_198153 [Colletotrichum falcatum]